MTEYKNNKSIRLIIHALLLSVLSALLLSNNVYAKNDQDIATDIGAWGIPVVAASIALIKEDNCDGFWMWAKGAASTFAVTTALKYSINEDRPNDKDSLSFPSGHTSAATQGAAYLQFRYGWKYGVPAYIGAGLVAYSRVDNDHHYWHDVIAGAALATGIQYLFTNRYVDPKTTTVAPVLSKDVVALHVSFRF